MYKEKLGILNEHSLKQTNSESKQKKGQDIDTTWYDEVDVDNNIVARYIVRDSISIYPPFSKRVEFEKYSLNGVLVDNGSL